MGDLDVDMADVDFENKNEEQKIPKTESNKDATEKVKALI